MIYPIVAYGDPVLKRKAKPIDPEGDVDVKQLVADMFETMYAAQGVGLAAPQVGKSLRLFVVDASAMDEELDGFKRAFVNPVKLEEDGKPWPFEEGCLSIPHVRENVSRPERIRLRYFDEDWNEHEQTLEGMAARVVQHEYDHIEGVLFTDHLNGFKKRLLKSRLNNISKGKVNDLDYKMRFPLASKARK